MNRKLDELQSHLVYGDEICQKAQLLIKLWLSLFINRKQDHHFVHYARHDSYKNVGEAKEVWCKHTNIQILKTVVLYSRFHTVSEMDCDKLVSSRSDCAHHRWG